MTKSSWRPKCRKREQFSAALLVLCVKPWKVQQQRQQWTRNGKNWRKFRRGTRRKSEVRNRWSMKQGRTAQKFISHHWWTYVICKMLNWRQSTKNTNVELHRWYCKRWLWCWCSIHRTRIISITNDSSKSHWYHFKIAWLRRTSSWPGRGNKCSFWFQ